MKVLHINDNEKWLNFHHLLIIIFYPQFFFRLHCKTSFQNCGPCWIFCSHLFSKLVTLSNNGLMLLLPLLVKKLSWTKKKRFWLFVVCIKVRSMPQKNMKSLNILLFPYSPSAIFTSTFEKRCGISVAG